jgi:hypothetical protein
MKVCNGGPAVRRKKQPISARRAVTRAIPPSEVATENEVELPGIAKNEKPCEQAGLLLFSISKRRVHILEYLQDGLRLLKETALKERFP